MFNIDDVVVITCEHPAGVTTPVFGNIGIIYDVFDHNGEMEYTVKDIFRNDFVYIESELRKATDEEISEAFVEVMKVRQKNGKSNL